MACFLNYYIKKCIWKKNEFISFAHNHNHIPKYSIVFHGSGSSRNFQTLWTKWELVLHCTRKYVAWWWRFHFRESHKLTDDQTLWANEAAERVYKLLEDTPPDGAAFAASIRHILKVEKKTISSYGPKTVILISFDDQREEIWSNWKNEGCLEFLPKVANDNAGGGNGSTDAAAEKKVVPGRARRPKRSLGDQVRDATKKSKTIIGK